MRDVMARELRQKRPAKAPVVPQEKRSKYRAVKETVDGFTFASRREAKHYRDLLMMGQLGIVRNLELQPAFPIVLNGVRIATYVADFRYELEEMVEDDVIADRGAFQVARVHLVWRDVIEDVKGFKTPVYRLKKKLVEAQYGIQIREIH